MRNTSFKNFTEEDKKAHEKFSSEQEMYEWYSQAYKIEVTPETKVKVIHFKLI